MVIEHLIRIKKVAFHLGEVGWHGAFFWHGVQVLSIGGKLYSVAVHALPTLLGKSKLIYLCVRGTIGGGE